MGLPQGAHAGQELVAAPEQGGLLGDQGGAGAEQFVFGVQHIEPGSFAQFELFVVGRHHAAAHLNMFFQVADPVAGGLEGLPGGGDLFPGQPLGLLQHLLPLGEPLGLFVGARSVGAATEQVVVQAHHALEILVVPFNAALIGIVGIAHLQVHFRKETGSGLLHGGAGGVQLRLGREDRRLVVQGGGQGGFERGGQAPFGQRRPGEIPGWHADDAQVARLGAAGSPLMGGMVGGGQGQAAFGLLDIRFVAAAGAEFRLHLAENALVQEHVVLDQFQKLLAFVGLQVGIDRLETGGIRSLVEEMARREQRRPGT